MIKKHLNQLKKIKVELFQKKILFIFQTLKILINKKTVKNKTKKESKK